jgi:DNA repair exonuclease SbcCD nuclease subunit
MEFNRHKVYVLGDIHGAFYWFTKTLKTSFTMQNCVLIQVGDFSIGFSKLMNELANLEEINRICKDKNIDLLIIRGNHDNPKYWGIDAPRFSNVFLINDYSYHTINGKKYFFLGGAISVNKITLKEGIEWWKEEEVNQKYDLSTLSEVDVAITHTAPDYCYPHGINEFVNGYCKVTKGLKTELIQERKFMNLVLDKVKPKYHYYGHFHDMKTLFLNHPWGTCEHTLLDVNEFTELKCETKKV